MKRAKAASNSCPSDYGLLHGANDGTGTPWPINRYRFLAHQTGGKLYEDAFDESWLKAMLKGNRSVDELLAALPASLRRSHLLSVNSRSTQFGDVKNPRVILSNSDSTFLLTFSGNPAQRGYNSIEAAIFDHERAEFVPYQIRISPNGILQKLEKNPQKCIGCHGENFRPIWNSYPFWPGFFGGGIPEKSVSAFALKLREAEEKAFDSFHANERDQGRYRHLVGASSFHELEDLNAAITLNLFELNAQRIKKMIDKIVRSRPDLAPLIRQAIRDLAAESAPSDIGKLMNAADAKNYKKSIRKLITETRARIDQDQAQNVKRHMDSFGINASKIGEKNIWSEKIGIPSSDANVRYNQFQTQAQNEKLLAEFAARMANLKFIVENLGKGSLADWSTEVAYQPGTLPYLANPVTNSWKALLY